MRCTAISGTAGVHKLLALLTQRADGATTVPDRLTCAPIEDCCDNNNYQRSPRIRYQ